jgi:hypothetical protein
MPGTDRRLPLTRRRQASRWSARTPDLYVRYFRDLRDLIAAGQPLTSEATIQAMSRYATEPATDFA